VHTFACAKYAWEHASLTSVGGQIVSLREPPPHQQRNTLLASSDAQNGSPIAVVLLSAAKPAVWCLPRLYPPVRPPLLQLLLQRSPVVIPEQRLAPLVLLWCALARPTVVKARSQLHWKQELRFVMLC